MAPCCVVNFWFRLCVSLKELGNRVALFLFLRVLARVRSAFALAYYPSLQVLPVWLEHVWDGNGLGNPEARNQSRKRYFLIGSQCTLSP